MDYNPAEVYQPLIGWLACRRPSNCPQRLTIGELLAEAA